MIDTLDIALSFIYTCVNIFIAYHIFFLSKRLSNKGKLEHKELIKQKAEELLHKINNESLGRRVCLVNISRYFEDYPSTEEKLFRGYSCINAEIKTTNFEGVEFFSSMPVAIYKKENGQFSFKEAKNREKIFNVFPVGVIPYESIEHIDLDGDEYGEGPLFYCYFDKKASWDPLKSCPFPYKKTLYYKKNEEGKYLLIDTILKN